LIALIPARGGSKGLPGKNTKLLNGIPLIAHTILAALNASQISRVIVSTENEEIAFIAKKYGAEVPFMRPQKMATDTALSIDAYEYTIKKLEANEKISIDNFTVLQPTSPLRSSQDIDAAITLFFKNKADSVISFCAEHHPISWHKYLETNGRIIHDSKEKLQNRQEFKPTYFPNGAIYILNKDVFQTRNYYSENTFAYLMERTNSIDIDTIEDFEYAEFLMQRNSMKDQIPNS